MEGGADSACGHMDGQALPETTDLAPFSSGGGGGGPPPGEMLSSLCIPPIGRGGEASALVEVGAASCQAADADSTFLLVSPSSVGP